MGLIELIIVVLVLMWLFGYFGRGRWYATGPTVGTAPAAWYSGNLLHTLLVIAVILLILRLLRVM